MTASPQPRSTRPAASWVVDLLDRAAQQLQGASIESPAHEARVIAGCTLGSEWELAGDASELSALLPAFESALARRCARTPLEHLTGTARFRRLELLVGPGVFVPQPETGAVVQWAADALRSLITSGRNEPLCVDLCTGSGTIALALADEVPTARVRGVEVDPEAMAWASKNAAQLGLDVAFQLGDVRALPATVTMDDGCYDLVTSNPPYVATGELAGVRPEVRDHDPAVALTAGPDGLDIIRCVERAAARLLRSGGLVAVEHSDRQGRSAPAVFESAGGWRDITEHQDFDGLDRFVTAVRL